MSGLSSDCCVDHACALNCILRNDQMMYESLLQLVSHLCSVPYRLISDRCEQFSRLTLLRLAQDLIYRLYFTCAQRHALQLAALDESHQSVRLKF